MTNWVKVFESEQLHKVEIVKDVLKDHQCDPVIVNKKDSAYKIFGQYEVHVAPIYAVKALHIIEHEVRFQ